MTTDQTTLHLSPLADRGLMVKRAQAEDDAARWLRSAVAAEPGRDHVLFMLHAEKAAVEANEYDAALVQRIGWSPVGIGRDWGGAA